jgi:hypothetical protein
MVPIEDFRHDSFDQALRVARLHKAKGMRLRCCFVGSYRRADAPFKRPHQVPRGTTESQAFVVFTLGVRFLHIGDLGRIHFPALIACFCRTTRT